VVAPQLALNQPLPQLAQAETSEDMIPIERMNPAMIDMRIYERRLMCIGMSYMFLD
jgi:hypothetical protein